MIFSLQDISSHSNSRYNNFTTDPLSECHRCAPHNYSAELTIAARCDLNDPNGTYPDSALGYRIHGATDAKVRPNFCTENPSEILLG